MLSNGRAPWHMDGHHYVSVLGGLLVNIFGGGVFGCGFFDGGFFGGDFLGGCFLALFFWWWFFFGGGFFEGAVSGSAVCADGDFSF